MKKIEVTVVVSQTFEIGEALADMLGLEDYTQEDLERELEAWVEENISDFAQDNFVGCDLKVIDEPKNK